MSALRNAFVFSLQCILIAEVVVFLTSAGTAQIRFQASPESVSPGQDIRLTWEIPNAKYVSIPGYGTHAPSGSLSITPARGEVVLLVAEFPNATIVRSVQIRVSGAKGDEEDYERTLSAFRYASDESLNCSFAVATDFVRKQLKQQLGFLSRFDDFSDGFVQIQTNRARLKLIQADLPRQFEARRTSFLIDVHPGTKAATGVKIRSLVETKRLLEDTWYPEKNDRFYEEATSAVRHLLEACK